MSECPLGYTANEVADMLEGDGLSDFYRFMRGQTVALCDGRIYNHENRRYWPTGCADSPHGTIFYAWDVERFLRGLPVID